MQAVVTFLQLAVESPICPVSRRRRPMAFLPSFILIARCSFKVSCSAYGVGRGYFHLVSGPMLSTYPTHTRCHQMSRRLLRHVLLESNVYNSIHAPRHSRHQTHQRYTLYRRKNGTTMRRLSLLLLLLLLSPLLAYAQFGNLFEQMFHGGGGGGRQREQQNVPSSSDWYNRNYEEGTSLLLLLMPRDDSSQ